MPTGTPPSDEERLPWLEPYREAPKTRPRAASAPIKRRGTMLVVGGVAAVAAALTAGYWAGQRTAPPAAAPAEIALTPAPAPKPAPIAPPPTVTPAPPVDVKPVAEAPPVVKAKAPAKRKYASASVRKKARRKASGARYRKIRSAGIESARLKAVKAAQERPAARRPVSYRAWPRMPSPGPAGQVIQLGAFRHPSGANRAYRARLARYPMLAGMPRVVVPVATKPRGQILYVLRLGTTSRQQSKTVCRNLRASGDHCLVIG